MQNNKGDVAGRGVENREVRAKLGRDYIENQKSLLKHKPQGGYECIQNGALVFSVHDDFKIYGAEALEEEFATRQYDPYRMYKQRLAGDVAHVTPRNLSETA